MVVWSQIKLGGASREAFSVHVLVVRVRRLSMFFRLCLFCLSWLGLQLLGTTGCYKLLVKKNEVYFNFFDLILTSTELLKIWFWVLGLFFFVLGLIAVVV